MWTRKHYAYILCEDETSISGHFFKKNNLILDGVQRPFVWTILLWLKCKMRSFLEVSQNVLRFNFMKLNQTNMVFAWSFADFGALSDSLTDGPNHHWYHHVDTLLILGWWLADPRWCNGKVSFWCWQVLIHFPFLVRTSASRCAMWKRSWKCRLRGCFWKRKDDISNSIASKKTNHISRSFCSSGFELIFHLVLSNLSLVTYQFQSRCCLA